VHHQINEVSAGWTTNAVIVPPTPEPSPEPTPAPTPGKPAPEQLTTAPPTTAPQPAGSLAATGTNDPANTVLLAFVVLILGGGLLVARRSIRSR